MHKKNSNYSEKGLEMQDRDYLSTILEIEKNMSNNYSIALNEASNDDLYETFFEMFTDIKDHARDIFDLMNNYGWYKLESVEETKIDQLIQKLTEKLDNLEDES